MDSDKIEIKSESKDLSDEKVEFAFKIVDHDNPSEKLIEIKEDNKKDDKVEIAQENIKEEILCEIANDIKIEQIDEKQLSNKTSDVVEINDIEEKCEIVGILVEQDYLSDGALKCI